MARKNCKLVRDAGGRKGLRRATAKGPGKLVWDCGRGVGLVQKRRTSVRRE